MTLIGNFCPQVKKSLGLGEGYPGGLLTSHLMLLCFGFFQLCHTGLLRVGGAGSRFNWTAAWEVCLPPGKLLRSLKELSDKGVATLNMKIGSANFSVAWKKRLLGLVTVRQVSRWCRALVHIKFCLLFHLCHYLRQLLWINSSVFKKAVLMRLPELSAPPL